jgi:hypothetical protein
LPREPAPTKLATVPKEQAMSLALGAVYLSWGIWLTAAA